MKEKRPVFLDLTKIRFPPPAIVSILHRASGVIVFLLIPLLLWLLGASLASEAQFQQLQTTLEQPGLRFFVWVVVSGLLFHLIAGIRHLIMDMGLGESLPVGRATAYVVIFLAAILIILTGIWLW